MISSDRDRLLKRIAALRSRLHNVTPRELERIAEEAGWVYSRTRGSHDIFVKGGFWANLAIPRTKVTGNVARKLLDLIEQSLAEDEEAAP
jgi:predicted RNA binding protein YcfA (HicA-like mRNA interferase family)